MSLPKAAAWLRRRAENVVVLMLLAMFLVFLLQIVSRYVLNWPIGWTHEISVLLWIWLVLFGAAFVVPDTEEMRFDLIYGAVGARTRRIMALITGIVTVVALVTAMPATWDYVSFMRVESTAYLGIPFNWAYAIYVIFAVAMIVRHLWIGFRAIYGKAPKAYDPTKASSGV
ncbi:TRAP transporter small permease [Paracoccus shanxieyensis]|uniref:TRAP transporter small permease protein n=1 Tax=Paracoccus shanxieyensis TaxID=2675752 RepID=A0A6L6ITX6_9RHOB|nr:TRAP transporter small permease [Paracoccus shanxieyensis]MTH63985.1 TRAP transporter small permease subunit [Paracoccus shanxieyensis]MTH86974.1 TRAP transporter small permease subunit [Paracoccus shanxieyensis]